MKKSSADENARKVGIAVANWLCGTLEGIALDNVDMALAESLDAWLRVQKKNYQVFYVGLIKCDICGYTWDYMGLADEKSNVKCLNCGNLQKIFNVNHNQPEFIPENKEALEKIRSETEKIILKIEGLNKTIRSINT